MEGALSERGARETSTRLQVAMVNLTKSATTLTAFAYCATGAAPTAHATTVSVAGHHQVTARATCPASTSLVFGGVEVSPPTGNATHFSSVAPFGMTAPSPEQWAVTAYDIGDVAGTVTAIAYCR